MDNSGWLTRDLPGLASRLGARWQNHWSLDDMV
jgi:hypothetical protein